jgi:hypothetical protein
MAISFHPRRMSATPYDEVIKRLEAAGVGNPAGRRPWLRAVSASSRLTKRS